MAFRLYWYMAKEVLSLTFVIMAALSSVMFLFRLLGYAEYIFVSEEGLLSILMFILFLLPAIFKLTVPISLFLATTVTVVRMSQDRELEAWMSVGVSPLRMAVGPVFVGALVFGLSLYSALILEPFSRQEWRRFKYLQTRKSFESLLEKSLQEKTFLAELFPVGNNDVSFYVDKLLPNRTDFEGVFFSFAQEGQAFSSILVSQKGSLQKSDEMGLVDYVLTLQNGKYFLPSVDKSTEGTSIAAKDVPPWAKSLGYAGEWNVVHFDQARISLLNLFARQFDPGQFDPSDMRSLYPRDYVRELRKLRASKDWGTNQRYVRDHSFFYEQLVVPFSCLLLPLIGLCLGIQDPRRKPGFAYLGLGVVVFLYYTSIMICQQLALKFFAPPEVSLVFPPLVLFLMSVALFRWRMTSPPSVTFIEYFWPGFLRKNLKKRLP